MAFYQIAVTRSANASKTVAVIRRYSPDSIASITSKIQATDTVLSISSDDYPVGFGSVEGARRQHELFCSAVAALQAIGDQVECRYRAFADYPVEIASEEMIQNLMASEIRSRAQLHD